MTLTTGEAGAFVPSAEKEITPISAPAELPETGFFSVATVNKIMPQNVKADSTPTQIQRDILNRSVDQLVKTEAPGIIQAAEKIEQQVQTEVAVKSDEGIEHKIKVKLIPLQAAARFDYTGLINASAIYKPAEADVDLTVTEQISDSTQFQLKHQTGEHISSLNVSVDW